MNNKETDTSDEEVCTTSAVGAEARAEIEGTSSPHNFYEKIPLFPLLAHPGELATHPECLKPCQSDMVAIRVVKTNELTRPSNPPHVSIGTIAAFDSTLTTTDHESQELRQNDLENPPIEALKDVNTYNENHERLNEHTESTDTKHVTT